MNRATVTIYSRPGCHLCEDAKAIILGAGLGDTVVIEEINIEDDPAIYDKYHYDIPVILINGIKVFKHKVDAAEFRRKLRRIAG